MAENKKIPEIRFKCFEGEWEDCELGRTVKITMGQSPLGVNYTDNVDDHILVQGNADIKNGHVLPRIWTTQITKTADSNDLIMTVRAPVGEVGKTAFDVVIGRGVAAIKGNEFIFQSLKRMNENGYWKKYSAGSTFDSINSNDLSSAIISTTTETEQTQIGTYFQNLDSLISLHQRKYDKLLKVKKAMLEKMFPKEGADVPEIRFKGFDVKWETKKLGDIGDLKNGMNFGKEAMGLGYPFVNLQNVFGKNIVDYSNLGLAVSSDNQRKEYNLLKGDILFIRSSVKPEGVGEAAVIIKNMENTTYSGFIIRFRPFVEMNIDFNRFIFSTSKIRNQIITSATSSANTNINQDSLKKIALMLPKIEEQTKIGTFFQNLDTLITQHQKELEKLKNIKKACLEKMFV